MPDYDPRKNRTDARLTLPGVVAGDRLGTEVGQGLHDKVSPEIRQTMAALAHRVASFMNGEGRDKKPVAIVQRYYEGLDNESPQDKELKRIKQQVQAAKEKLSARDEGDLEDRQPVSMSREFPSTAQGKADQEEYIRNARETARKALNK